MLYAFLFLLRGGVILRDLHSDNGDRIGVCFNWVIKYRFGVYGWAAWNTAR
jgi:hypothetical protein